MPRSLFRGLGAGGEVQDLALALAEIPTLAALEGAQDTPAGPADVDLICAVDETGKAGQAVHLF